MQVDFILPVHNESLSLDACVRRLYTHLRQHSPYRWKLIVIDHGSTDGTFWSLRRLAEDLEGVEALQVAATGRGQALRRGSQSFGDIFCYLDPRLPTDLQGVFRLTSAVANDGWDLAVGRVRTANGHWSERLAQCVYSLSLRATLRLPIAEPACPFRALSRRAAIDLLAETTCTDHFFDVELVALARARGYRIQQVEPPTVAESTAAGLASLSLEELWKRTWELRRRQEASRRGTNQ